ncbi:MAG: DUF3078 domain-containing protein [Calditrichaeota bacterium]|nr:DUF3078 domain-containing protein [Calditrichota bacterium]
MKHVWIITICITIIALLSLPLQAGDWEKSIDANLMFSQNSYSNNWTGGETGSVTWTFNANLMAQKQLSEKVHNKNTLRLSFGQTHNQDTATKDWQVPAKSTDLIDYETLFRFTLGYILDPFAAGRLETQFLDMSDPAKNRSFNPLKFTESFGVAKVLIKDDDRELTTRLGFGLRQLMNRDALNAVTSVREDLNTNDGGIEFVADYTATFAEKRIGFASKLGLFKAVFYSEADALKGLPNEDYWQAVDINWENRLSASVTQFVTVELYLQLLYDKEINLAGRLKQTLALGLTYKFL